MTLAPSVCTCFPQYGHVRVLLNEEARRNRPHFVQAKTRYCFLGLVKERYTRNSVKAFCLSSVLIQSILVVFVGRLRRAFVVEFTHALTLEFEVSS